MASFEELALLAAPAGELRWLTVTDASVAATSETTTFLYVSKKLIYQIS